MLDAIYDGGIDIMRIIRQLFAVCTRVYGEYISGIFCILDDSGTLGIFDGTAFDAPVLQYPALTEYSSDTLHSEYSLAISCLEYFIGYIFFLY